MASHTFSRRVLSSSIVKSLIEEYSFNGQVYMVKITPRGGVPYYYIDTDGDGKLELDVDKQALNPVQPVYWKIKEWK